MKNGNAQSFSHLGVRFALCGVTQLLIGHATFMPQDIALGAAAAARVDQGVFEQRAMVRVGPTCDDGLKGRVHGIYNEVVRQK